MCMHTSTAGPLPRDSEPVFSSYSAYRRAMAVCSGCRRSSVTLPAAGLDLLRLYGSFPSFAPDGASLSYISYPGMSGVSAVGLDGAEPRILAKVCTPRL